MRTTLTAIELLLSPLAAAEDLVDCKRADLYASWFDENVRELEKNALAKSTAKKKTLD